MIRTKPCKCRVLFLIWMVVVVMIVMLFLLVIMVLVVVKKRQGVVLLKNAGNGCREKALPFLYIE